MDNSNKEKNFVSAVVYCYNDSATIGPFLNHLDQELKNNFLKYEIIVVNDSSDDDSSDIITKYGSQREGAVITLLNMSGHHGVELSMNAGLNLSIGDFVFEFDMAQEDFNRSLLMEIYRKSLTGYDIVNANPDSGKRFFNTAYLKLFNHFAKLQHPIGRDHFRVISRRAINRIHSITQTIPFRKVAYANCGLAVSNIDYHPLIPIKSNTEKVTPAQAVDSFILFTDLAYKITLTLAGFMMLVTIGMGVYAIVLNLFRTPVEGWTTTVVFMSMGFTGLFVILSMVIKYLQTIVNLNFKKKEYLFESITKLQ